jgi:hypothetical protein
VEHAVDEVAQLLLLALGHAQVRFAFSIIRQTPY